MDRYDMANWTRHPPRAIHPGSPTTMPLMTASLLLVRWIRGARTAPFTGTLRGMILSPLGTPNAPVKLFQISDVPDFYEFWQLQTDGLPYTLIAQAAPGSKYASQLVIWEFTPRTKSESISESISDISFQSSSSNNLNVNMAFSTQGSPLTSTNSTISSVAASAGSFLGVPANGSRVGGFGVNNTNKVVWVSFGAAPAAPNKPSTPVPVGGNFDIPPAFTGAINLAIAIGGANPAGTLDITEFLTS